MANDVLLECVPNFSAGRDGALLDALASAVRGVAGAVLLDHSRDPDHNRSVLTFAGGPDAVVQAACAAARVATARIDLSRHEGVHPRMGATDVVPVVPLSGRDRAAAIAAAHAIGTQLGDALRIPVFYYGAAAPGEGERTLPAVRRGGFEALRAAIGSDPGRVPDAGPTDAIHPTAGATAVGVRPFLVAFNVDLDADDLAAAKAIAAEVRESNGGLPGIRALGLALPERGVAQVSLNVVDHERTGLVRVFERIEALARERGIGIRSSELIGLAPAAALDASIAARVRLAEFDPERHVLERRLESALRATR